MVEGQVPRSGTLVPTTYPFLVRRGNCHTVYSNTTINSGSYLGNFIVCYRLFICVIRDQTASEIFIYFKKSRDFSSKPWLYLCRLATQHEQQCQRSRRPHVQIKPEKLLESTRSFLLDKKATCHG